VKVLVNTDQGTRMRTFIKMTCFECEVTPEPDYCVVEFRGDT